ncbi:MAG: SH3 domain-containing protein [Clostridia bacterium]|nr:SH3 domain-containing protein [Clostridia bacterium]
MKRVCIGFVLLLTVCSVFGCALANSWGLTGPLLRYVMDIKDLEDYSSVTEYYRKNCRTSAAVMRSRYHNILLVYGTDANGDQTVWRSTTAVWQPGEMDDTTPVVTCTDGSVTLKTDSFSTFVFTWDNVENTFLLTRAEYGDFSLSLRDGMYCTDSGQIWQARPIDIQTFNVSLFPRTEYDVLRMNRVRAAVSDAADLWYEDVTAADGKTLPVFSAPDTGSYRAAKGKASVNTAGDLRLLASVGDWDLVEYEVSYRTCRTGWISKASLSKNAPVMMTDVPVLSAEYLTDDPFRSQYRTFNGTELMNIHLLALADPFYAYASAETTDGQTVWGFVPVRGCVLPDEEEPLQISSAELTYTDPGQDIRTYGFGYEKLEDRWKPFFPEETWSKARFLTDSEWENKAAYNAEHNWGLYKHYPIVTVLDGNVQVHLFNVEGDDISKIAETARDSGLKETEENKATAPIYHLTDAVGEMDGIYRYRETLNIYFNGSADPWNTQIVFETEVPDDPDVLHVTSVGYQYNSPRKTFILGQKYDNEIIIPSTEGIEYGYGYWDEPITDALILPLKGSTVFSEFTIASFPSDPEELLTEAKIDTKKHGSGGKVNLRRQPGKNAKSITTIPNGSAVNMADIGNGWCFVHYKNHYGYVMAEFVEGTDPWIKDRSDK